ncbi:hypothetical protein KBC75_05870, partial [Candidatus Shapirobacteria bacterium]|nr:hypothetical protein [Candidatus Shapirobacteria bacterium]
KLGVNPNQVVDLKALMGDMSDNYPGVAGIGPKTAINLLTTYVTLDNIYKSLSDLNHLNGVSNLVRSRLIADRDNAYLSQKLAKLVDTVPLKFSLRSSLWSSRNIDGLSALFDQYHFKSLSARLHRHHPQVAKTKPTIDTNQGSLF